MPLRPSVSLMSTLIWWSPGGMLASERLIPPSSKPAREPLGQVDQRALQISHLHRILVDPGTAIGLELDLERERRLLRTAAGRHQHHLRTARDAARRHGLRARRRRQFGFLLGDQLARGCGQAQKSRRQHGQGEELRRTSNHPPSKSMRQLRADAPGRQRPCRNGDPLPADDALEAGIDRADRGRREAGKGPDRLHQVLDAAGTPPQGLGADMARRAAARSGRPPDWAGRWRTSSRAAPRRRSSRGCCR